MLTAYVMPQLNQNARANGTLIFTSKFRWQHVSDQGCSELYTVSLGYEIKKEQLYVIVQYVLGRDVSAVLPTGYGKSLCYQALPTVFNQIFFDGKDHYSIIIVISPLIAIMKDQVNYLLSTQ